MTPRALLLVFAAALAARADTLILKDGTHVTGRWWSIDAAEVHFLVDNQLHHFARAQVSAVTFGDATLPAPPTPAPAAQPPAQAPPAPAAPAEPAPRAPSLSRPPSLNRNPPPAASSSSPSPAPASAPARAVDEPDQIAAVYFQRTPREFVPLDHTQAVERRRGSSSYFEIAGPQARMRVKEATELVFVVRLPKGLLASVYSLFPLVPADGARRTESPKGQRNGLVTWPFAIATIDESGYVTYSFTVRDLPPGEYSFSPSTSNDGYCFGVDPAPAAR